MDSQRSQLRRAWVAPAPPLVYGVALLLFLLLTSCSRPPELIGVDIPEVPVASVPNATRHTIFLATCRQATEATGAFYSAARAPEPGLAAVVVSVPPNHVVGNLERPKRLPSAPRNEITIIEPTVYATDDAFVRSVNKELAIFPRGKRDILFFVHGYNSTTSDALLRLAQFVEDSGLEGVPVLIDWASASKLTRYVYELNSALVARPQLEEFGRIVDRTNAEDLARLGLNAIDLSEISDATSGSHSKFAGTPEVVRLLGNGPNNNQSFNRSGRATHLGELPHRLVPSISREVPNTAYDHCHEP